MKSVLLMKPLAFSAALVKLEDYVIMRKVDGNRAVWDATMKVLYSKQGQTAAPPAR